MITYIRQHCARVSLFVALFFSYGLALAQGPEGDRPTVWHCWYNNDGSFTVACEYRGPGEATEAALAEADEDEFIETASPGRSMTLPPIVRRIREKPASLAGQRMLIPLYTQPFEMDFVRQLADAVMCGAGKNCTVVFGQDYTASASNLTAH